MRAGRDERKGGGLGGMRCKEGDERKGVRAGRDEGKGGGLGGMRCKEGG